MDNIYIKWKLKSFQIDIYYWKILFDKKIFVKIEFFKIFDSDFTKKIFFERKFFKIFKNNPQNYFFPLVVNTKNDN